MKYTMIILFAALSSVSTAGTYWTADQKIAFSPLPGYTPDGGSDLSPFPLEQVFANLHDNRPAGWKATGLNRGYYLDMMEPVVRAAAEWVDEKGAVIDPVLKREWGQTSSRFASAGAVLIYFNRLADMPDLKEKVYRVLDYTCEKLSRPEVTECSPDFWMRELTVAVLCLTHIAPPERVAHWREALSKVSPEDVLKCVDKTGAKLGKFNNWALFGASGEAMRQAMGIGGPEDVFWGDAFFDRYLEPQYIHFTEYGMYRDPHDPFTYDITTRVQLSCALMWGYRGRNFLRINELLRRGALTTLRYLSPQGYVPFGGRSAQFQFQEAMTATLCELEALRYRDSNPRLAGMFKRQAHLCAQLIYPYLMQEKPHRHIKNYFDPSLLHGCDGYGQYSVYSLVASGFLGLAALYADDGIVETPTLSENGSYAFYLKGAFHKLFADCQGNCLEYDTCGQVGEDATGLGRILLKGVPYGLLPAMPFARDKKYRVGAGLPNADYPASVAPVWNNAEGAVWRLAQKARTEDNGYELLSEIAEAVSFRLKWAMKEASIVETWTLTPTELVLEGQLGGDCQNGVWEVPVLEFDGKHRPVVVCDGKSVMATLAEGGVRITGSSTPTCEEQRVTNRNGYYRVFSFPVDAEGRVTIRFQCLQ